MEASQGKKCFRPRLCLNCRQTVIIIHQRGIKKTCILFPWFSLEDTLCEETVDWPLDIDDLLRFSFEVAQGLDFLAAKNVSD